MNNPKEIHEMCKMHAKLEQEIEDSKKEIERFGRRLDYIMYILVIICIETGITIPLMG